MRQLMLVAALTGVLLVDVGVSAVRTTQAVATAQGHLLIRDLGTLGGPESYVVDINERGQLVGQSDTRKKDGGGWIERAFLWQNGKMRDLGTLGGRESWLAGTDDAVVSINDRGQVAGSSETRARYFFDGCSCERQPRHAFLWQTGKMRDLGTLGGRESYAAAINNRGQVVGRADTGKIDHDSHDEPLHHAFLWQNGKMRDLGTLGGKESAAFDINDRGQVVGWADKETGFTHVFLWEKGKMRDLGDFTAVTQLINEGGKVIGIALTTKTLVEHAFLWRNKTWRDLGTLGESSEADAINDKGQVVGDSDTDKRDSEYVFHAFLWQNGKMRDLGTLGGESSDAAELNEQGQVVGGSDIRGKGNHAFLWQKGTMLDLGTLGGPDSRGNGINDRGQVAGRADTKLTDDKGEPISHAVLWTFKR